MKVYFLLITVLALSVSACKKTEQVTELQVKLSYKVDSKSLVFDTTLYICDAGYAYEITRLNYYLSGFVFKMNDGSEFKSDGVYYVDAKQAALNTLTIDDFPNSTCTQVNFYIGLDSAKNQTDSLPATVDNINMGWPDMMGGGYHFMKLEGHYIDNAGTYGYAMHLGKNKNLVHIQLNNPVMSGDGNILSLDLTMNINEWLRNPQVYDFKTDGSYSMNDDTAMQKLCINGADIFN